MNLSELDRGFVGGVIKWTARIAAIAAIVPLSLIVFGENGHGPDGFREWLYLALFPFGFSAGYLLAWRWPLAGGSLSLICMATSLLIIGRTFGWGPYLIWSILILPGILFIVSGWLSCGSTARQAS
jgi:hypothetical protein